MASIIDIVNRSLSKLGESQITSLDDPVEAAKLAASIYVPVRDAEIEAYAWNFAKHRVMLPADMERPAFGWVTQYTLPSDCLRVLEAGPWPQAIMSGFISRDTSAFSLEGRKILTNYGPALNLIYLRRIEDSGFYPAVFVEALACKLAMEMAERLSGSNSKRQLAMTEYDMAVRSARRLNAIGRPSVSVQDDTWMAAHFTGVI